MSEAGRPERVGSPVRHGAQHEDTPGNPAPAPMPLLVRVARIAWPAFLVAGVAEIVFFSVFDPFELHFFGAPLDLTRLEIYTMGFFGFWGLAFAAAALALWLDAGRADEGARSDGAS